MKVPVLIVPIKQPQPDLYYEVDGHWNPSGHVFVADLILKNLHTRLVKEDTLVARPHARKTLEVILKRPKGKGVAEF